MIFTAPWLLPALALLPLLYWLLRATPPTPRRQVFPAIRLLAGLHVREETPARTPLWLLLLRVMAMALLILGLAGPVLDAAKPPAGHGPLLLVIDNGWASAADWPARMSAANAALDIAARTGRPAAMLATAPDATEAPHITPPMPARALRNRLAALRPRPWSVDRAAAAAALATWQASQGGNDWIVYLADNVATPQDGVFAAVFSHFSNVRDLRADLPDTRLLRAPRLDGDKLVAVISQLPRPAASTAAVLAQSMDGRTLGRATVTIPAGAQDAEAPIDLPLELRNRLGRLALSDTASAGAVTLLDEASRRRPVGLLTAGPGADAPLLGPLFYLRQALDPTSDIRVGDVSTLLSRDLSVIIATDRRLTHDEADRLDAWIRRGGVLIRFAGPNLAQETTADDPLLPVPLLGGDRQLGGSLSWSKPANLAAFPSDSPFAGLTVPQDVTVNRQVLAAPSAGLDAHSWARLADGTPLVTAKTEGAGHIVLFHVTANTDWSNLPLSGLFPQMLHRLNGLAAGVAFTAGQDMLAPTETLDGFGTLGPPPAGAQAIRSDKLLGTVVSAQHPPGFYGPTDAHRALNIGTAAPPLAMEAAIPGTTRQNLAGIQRERQPGPWLIGAGTALLAVDLLLALALRGLLRFGLAVALVLLPLSIARAQDASNPTPQDRNMQAALETKLAYVVSGDPQVDQIAHAGLAGLSDYVNHRTAAQLGDPVGVTPGQDDLSVYPLLYWPIVPSTAPSDRAVAALNEFMRNGGIILIDTRDSGSGEGFAPGTEAALRRIHGLDVPPLVPLATDHVLAHTFYLLRHFPGRFQGGPVWVQRDEDRSNDSVSPVIIGGNDWASAWAVDADGRYPYTVLPDGENQRTLAYRFGVNLVMYALTGNYKGDQIHVPALLQRLGQ